MQPNYKDSDRLHLRGQVILLDDGNIEDSNYYDDDNDDNEDNNDNDDYDENDDNDDNDAKPGRRLGAPW